MMDPTVLTTNLMKKKFCTLKFRPTPIHFKTTSSLKREMITISSSKEIFKETASYYEQYLSNCGYNKKLNYCDPAPLNLITK